MPKAHVLLRKKGNSTQIAATAPTRKGIIKKAQPIINRNPRTKFRYGAVSIQKDMPWFRKGE